MTKSTRLILSLFFALILLTACSGIKQADQKAVLRAEIAKWQNFRADGVIQVSNQGLSMRKFFVLNKTSGAIRLDVLDGGVFGLSPTPLISAYLGEQFVFQAPTLQKLESMVPDSLDQAFSLSLLSDPDSLVSLYGDEIIATRKLLSDNIELGFSDKLRLETMTEKRSGAMLKVLYNSKGDPQKVSITLGKDTILDLIPDTMTYGNAEVIPLQPKPETPPSEMDIPVQEDR
jgi:hypothetical protein